MIPLFQTYPELAKRVPYLQLAQLPTPVERMAGLEEQLHPSTRPLLYVKRDDLSAPQYGGNKVRKLEFILAKAIEEKRRTVITFGTAGSNHVAATAVFACPLGLRCLAFLVPQPETLDVERNQRTGLEAGAELRNRGGLMPLVGDAAWCYLARSLGERRFPMVIPPGGTMPVGTLGYVNAAFELAGQVQQGEMPTPDAIYVASGSTGTAVGLLLGCALAGLSTRIEAIRVTQPQYSSLGIARRHFRAVHRLLRDAVPSLPDLPFPCGAFSMRHEFYGSGYALSTPEGGEATRRVREAHGLQLETTYTGKAFAALLADAASGRLHDQTVIFWSTQPPNS